MRAYVISDIDVTDAEAFEQYKLLSAPSVERHGGRFLVRGGSFEVIEGNWSPKRLSILEFPDVATAEKWIGSDEYRPAREIRNRSANTNIVLVQGGS